jgi:hypothetical protein
LNCSREKGYSGEIEHWQAGVSQIILTLPS